MKSIIYGGKDELLYNRYGIDLEKVLGWVEYLKLQDMLVKLRNKTPK